MINFLEVENSVRELKKQLATGQIDEKSFEACLLEMIDVANDGYYWMFGHESEQWFRHNGEQWIAADPNTLLTNPVQAESPAPSDNRTEQPQRLDEFPVNWGWLMISIIMMVAIGWTVYASF